MSTQTTDHAAIETLYKEIMAKQAKLNDMLKLAPGEPVENATFKAAGDTNRTLADCFGKHSDLIVIHNMGKSCPYCTLWLDGFAGMHDHFTNRAAFVVVSPDTPAVQAEFAASRNWPFEFVSNADSGFTKAMGYASKTDDGKTSYTPGFSTFKKSPDGTITRVGRSYFGPGDSYCGIWHMFELLDGGTGEWQPKFTY